MWIQVLCRISWIKKIKSVAYSSQGSHTGQLNFCNWSFEYRYIYIYIYIFKMTVENFTFYASDGNVFSGPISPRKIWFYRQLPVKEWVSLLKNLLPNPICMLKYTMSFRSLGRKRTAVRSTIYFPVLVQVFLLRS